MYGRPIVKTDKSLTERQVRFRWDDESEPFAILEMDNLSKTSLMALAMYGANALIRDRNIRVCIRRGATKDEVERAFKDTITTL